MKKCSYYTYVNAWKNSRRIEKINHYRMQVSRLRYRGQTKLMATYIICQNQIKKKEE